MADRVSVSRSNKISPSYSVGASSKIGYKHEGALEGTIEITYSLETQNEPNYAIVTGLKSYQSSHNGAAVSVAGLNFSGFLNSYNFNVSPNNVVSVSVGFSFFSETGGQFSSTDAGYSNYNLTQGSGLAHYWTSRVVGDGVTGAVIELGYNFSAEWKPHYKIGRPYPYSVSFISATERIQIMSEYDIPVKFSGQALTGFSPYLNELRIGPISGLYNNTNTYLSFSIGESQITQSSMDLSNNLITNNISAINNY